MDTRFQKWVTVSYVAVGVLLGYIASAALNKIVGIYDLETRIRNVYFYVQGASVALGFILFIVLLRHKQVNDYMNEVMVELSRVSWPTQKETSSATIIVIIMVLISGMILGFLDYLWTVLLKAVV